jgi:murein DD-endopeptidase MepM/ murein hydrolase activator NlpD
MPDPVAPEPNTFTWPVNQADRRVSSQWGAMRPRKHWGMDIASTLPASSATPILSVAPGTVVYCGVSGRLGPNPSAGQAGGGSGYGNCIIIYHGVNSNNRHIYSVYGHLSSFNVTMGASVAQGVQIGVMGNTGGSRGRHLHFTIYRSTGTQRLPLPSSGTGALGFMESSVSINPMGSSTSPAYLR